MNWNKKFATRTHWMKRSAVRELLKVTARPEIISFAGGLPAAELFPMGRVQTAVNAVLSRLGGQALQYGETEGIGALRDWIAARFSREGCRVTRDNVIITSGGQQALDLTGRVLLNQGDRVAVESPTYLALLSAWRPLGVEFLPVASDDEGMQMTALEEVLRQEPKLIYLVPNFQNPQGTTLARARRERLLSMLEGTDVVVLEDNPYGELRYSGEPLPHLLELDARSGTGGGLESRIIYTGTFSKVLMPGLRVGWVVAEREVIDKMVQAKQAADLHTSTLSQHVVMELLTEGVHEELLPALRRNYCERRDVMLAALAEHFPSEVEWTRPEGGMFLMLRLPMDVDAAELLPKAFEQGVAYVPGEEFHLNGDGKNTIRLNFSNANPERIRIGIGRLGALLGKCAAANV